MSRNCCCVSALQSLSTPGLAKCMAATLQFSARMMVYDGLRVFPLLAASHGLLSWGKRN